MRNQHSLQVTGQPSDNTADTEAAELAAAITRMHARDRARVAAGELRDADLHLIPAEMARRSIVRWVQQTTFRFRR